MLQTNPSKKQIRSADNKIILKLLNEMTDTRLRKRLKIVLIWERETELKSMKGKLCNDRIRNSLF